MAQKCVHQSCGKSYTDPDEPCQYHPGPPIFHEGQKGWKCCKPRVLTFEEFMSIPPCTTGKHSTTDLPPKIEKSQPPAGEAPDLVSKLESLQTSVVPTRTALAPRSATATPPPAPPPESEDDDPSLEIPEGTVCRRRTCGKTYEKDQGRQEDEHCVHHPGIPIFHEGSKGYTCCKRRVLEFDQFMKIEGCQSKPRHLFIGSGRKGQKSGQTDGEERLENVRNDFYQTPAAVIASFFLKKINKDAAKVEFQAQTLVLDLPTTDAPTKRYVAEVPLFAPIDPLKSSFKILGSKLEVSLAKADGSSWPALRSDAPLTGEILQVGRAGRIR